MSNQESSKSRRYAPVFWRVEDVVVDGSLSGKGVPVRLAGSVRNVPPPQQLIRYPGLSVLNVRGEPVRAGSFYRVDIKGSARRGLGPGTLLFPVWDEQFFSARAVVSMHESASQTRKRPAPGAVPPAQGMHLVPGGLPAALVTRHMVPVKTLRDTGGVMIITLARIFPFVPGSTVMLCDPSGRQRTRCSVLTALPAHLDGSQAPRGRRPATPEPAGDAGSREAAYRLFGFVGHPGILPGPENETETAPAGDAVRISSWWVRPDRLAGINGLLVRSCRHHGGLNERELSSRLIAATPGVGAGFSRALISAAVSEFLTKRDGRYYPADTAVEQLLPPAARRLLEQLEAAGRVGLDIGKAGHPNTRSLIESLDRLGKAVLLDNALVLAPSVLHALAEEAIKRLRSGATEIHQRDLAEIWGVPRNTSRAVVARLVRDKVLSRTSSVHVRIGTRSRP